MPSFISRLSYHVASKTPVGARQWLYRHPRLHRMLAAWLKRRAPLEEAVIVTIPGGPLAGLKLAVNRRVPNYLWARPDYEPTIQRVLETHLQPGMIVADIGAHIGVLSMHMSRLVGPGGVVYALEPDPANFALLSRNVTLNSLSQVRPTAIAASDAPRRLRFNATGTTVSHYVSGENAPGIEVAADSLDGIFFHRGVHPVLIKVDVEGAEVDVLRGAERLLRSRPPIWLIEVHSAVNLHECRSLLTREGYLITMLDAESELEPPDPPGPFAICHLLAVPAPR